MIERRQHVRGRRLLLETWRVAILLGHHTPGELVRRLHPGLLRRNLDLGAGGRRRGRRCVAPGGGLAHEPGEFRLAERHGQHNSADVRAQGRSLGQRRRRVRRELGHDVVEARRERQPAGRLPEGVRVPRRGGLQQPGVIRQAGLTECLGQLAQVQVLEHGLEDLLRGRTGRAAARRAHRRGAHGGTAGGSRRGSRHGHAGSRSHRGRRSGLTEGCGSGPRDGHGGRHRRGRRYRGRNGGDDRRRRAHGASCDTASDKIVSGHTPITAVAALLGGLICTQIRERLARQGHGVTWRGGGRGVDGGGGATGASADTGSAWRHVARRRSPR